MRTEIEITKFKGSDVLTIWEVDENGERKKFPVIAFGKKKGEALVKHWQDVKEFVGAITTEDVPWEA
jgi:hypothetical protein